ncbi:MAG: hypothetical protein JNK99_15610 [Candidatus Accumulibacter sp.]|uniref:Mor transcription activator family protein n=1 Tax=Accumulibacter sp. TaxID=2053492 RepID=UPI001A5469AD|nr:Mor transcription activator family protein [Accumulibacter sp.]MBL8396146.1 hypothetical protein [Accumulibacter sp.]
MPSLLRLTPEDCEAVSGLLPYTALVLIATIGAAAACTLLNERPGVTINLPRRPDANPAGARRWAELAELIGEPAMAALAARFGGEVLSIPVCKAARAELRARAIRAMYDRLIGVERFSGRQAIYEIGLAFAPITSRAIEGICTRADDSGPVQPDLF